MSLINNNSRILSEEKSQFNNNICSNIYKKNRSDNGLPFLVCNQFNKHLISGINPISDNSTKNSSSIMREKTLNIKKKIGINIYVRLTPENLDKIIDSKKRAFDALENLIQNDIIEEETKENGNELDNSKIENNYQNKIYKTQNTQNIINNKNKKKKKGISVPKLDFTSIYKHYSKRTLRIQEVKYFSKYIQENDDSESSHHYNHYHHHKSSKKKN